MKERLFTMKAIFMNQLDTQLKLSPQTEESKYLEGLVEHMLSEVYKKHQSETIRLRSNCTILKKAFNIAKNRMEKQEASSKSSQSRIAYLKL